MALGGAVDECVASRRETLLVDRSVTPATLGRGELERGEALATRIRRGRLTLALLPTRLEHCYGCPAAFLVEVERAVAVFVAEAGLQCQLVLEAALILAVFGGGRRPGPAVVDAHDERVLGRVHALAVQDIAIRIRITVPAAAAVSNRSLKGAVAVIPASWRRRLLAIARDAALEHIAEDHVAALLSPALRQACLPRPLGALFARRLTLVRTLPLAHGYGGRQQQNQ